MANEIGYWNSGAGATTYTLFGTGGNKAGNVAAGLYTASANQTITALRARVATHTTATALSVGLFATSVGAITGSPIYTPVALTITADNQTVTASPSWALTNGVVYALACIPDAVITLTADTRTNGVDRDDNGGVLNSAWSHTDFQNFAIELAGDVTTSAAANVGQPWQAQGAMGVMVSM